MNLKVKNINAGLLIFRMSLGVLMLLHGIFKMSDLGSIIRLMEENSLPGFIAYGVFLGEILAPLMLLIGFRTRIAAMIYAVNCLVALLMGNDDAIFALHKYGGWDAELLGLYLFGATALIFSGNGQYAVSTGNNWD